MATAPKGTLVNYDPELGRPPNSVAIEVGPGGKRKASRKSNRKGSRKSRKCGWFKNRKASRKNTRKTRKNRKASRRH
jgi:hypothetical protein